MYIPPIKFVSDLKKEADLVCFNAGSLARGYYQKGNFLILPSLPRQIADSVHFPNLGYSAKFWRSITKMSHNDYSKPYPAICHKEVITKLQPTNFDQNLIKEWVKIAPKFWQFCSASLSLSKTVKSISCIEVLPTMYGTRGSFYPVKTKSGYKIYLSHRIDFPVNELSRTLLLVLCKIARNKSGEIGELAWEQRRAAVDFVLGKSKYKKATDKQRLESKSYLSLLGLSNKTLPDVTKLRPHLTVKEYLTLEKLQTTPNQVVSYDSLAESIWGREVNEKFSLYAISKHIQTLRRKLSLAGYNSNLIQTSPTQGYFLSD